ncbi:MAG: hypothetical protein A2X34_09720 [Elusimicrobia bacterium GWC2_51_8]|nr:MAG: hypothetical protein A2X33_10170 [Elusimicrobia bacterium GWA2_51_34]OGR61142.1 MAG: hypothetical protein A2X34_09720 [Elusimicrobia bacterium GWC2_51_8]OGR84728.1 MAG: hypothetical protein A2021_03885 [Elusimicrobia bacterium GWF2_52_66]
MAEKNKWRLIAIIAGGVILGIFLVDHFINYAAQTSASYMNILDTNAACQQDLKDLKSAYYDCIDERYNDLESQQAGTDFLVKNYAMLQFPSCFKDLHYMTTSVESILHVSNGNYIGWAAGNFSHYCWNNETDFFECEELCSG